jgi:ketosteroid isomerase-like protein
MRFVGVVLFLILLQAPWGAAQGISAGSVPARPAEIAVRRADEAFQRALLAADTTALERLLAVDWTFRHFNGVLQTREQFVGQVTGGRRSFAAMERDDVKVRLLGQSGEGAVLTARTRRDETVEGRHFQGWVYSIHVWAREQGEWRLVTSQTTAARERQP